MENPHFSSPQIDGRQYLAQRAASSMVRSLGPTLVSLRIAEPSKGDLGNQLGITNPTVEDVPLSPALVRGVSAAHEPAPKYEVVLSVASLQQAIENYKVTDVVSWLLTSVAMVYGDKLLHVDSVNVERHAGSEYLYRVSATQME
jgi:hypothetical protein